MCKDGFMMNVTNCDGHYFIIFLNVIWSQDTLNIHYLKTINIII